MALPKVRVDVDANTAEAEAALDRVDQGMARVGRTAAITGGQVGHMSERFRNTARDSRVFGRGIQNAAYQLGDFATQVGAGTSASIALGQQLPQLFVGFGTLGAVIGAVIAIAVPLSRSFTGLTSDTEALNNILGTTVPLFEAMSRALARVREFAISMAEVVLNNFDRIVIIAGVAAVAFGARLVGAFVAARLAAMTLSGALVFLRGALIRTGIGALIVGAGELVYQFTRLMQAVGGFGAAMGMLREVGASAVASMRAALARMESGWASMQASIYDYLQGLTDSVVSFGNRAAATFQGAFDAIKVIWGALPSVIGDLVYGSANRMIQGIESMLNSAITRVNAFTGRIRDALAAVGIETAFGEIGEISLGGITNPYEGAAGAAGTAAAEAFRAAMGQTFVVAPDLFGGMADDARFRSDAYGEAAGMLDRQAGEGPLAMIQRIRDLLASIRDDRITLPDLLGTTVDEEDNVGNKLDEQLTAQEERIRRHFDIIRGLTEGGLSDKLGAWGNYFSNLVTLTGTNNRRLLSLGRAFQAAQSLVDAWGAFTKVLNDPALIGRPFARVAAAGQVLAAGIGAVNAIRQVGDNGSGPTSASSANGGATGGFSMSSQPAELPTQTLRFDFGGQNAMGMDQIVDLLNDAYDRGYRIRAIMA
jgi:hypothetical protein